MTRRSATNALPEPGLAISTTKHTACIAVLVEQTTPESLHHEHNRSTFRQAHT